MLSVPVILIGSAIMVLAVAIIVCISIQQGKSQGLGAMAGGSDADSYFSKNKKRTRDAILAKMTIVMAVLIVLCVIVLNIVTYKTITANTPSDSSTTTSDVTTEDHSGHDHE